MLTPKTIGMAYAIDLSAAISAILFRQRGKFDVCVANYNPSNSNCLDRNWFWVKMIVPMEACILWVAS